MSAFGSIYLDSPRPTRLQVSAERSTDYGMTISAAVTVHHEPGQGVHVSPTFPDRDALAAYARQLLELAEVPS